MNSVLNLLHEIDVKNKEKGEKYLKTLLIVSFIGAIILGFITNPIIPIQDKLNPFLMWFLNSYLLGILFMIFGVICMMTVSIGEVTKPHVQNKYQTTKTFVNMLVNSPDKREVLRAIKLFNDIIKKNAIEKYYDLSKVFDSFYKRIGRTEERLDTHDDEIKQIKFKLEQEHELRIKVENELKKNKQTESIIDDLSFTDLRQQKELDKSQTKLDEF